MTKQEEIVIQKAQAELDAKLYVQLMRVQRHQILSRKTIELLSVRPGLRLLCVENTLRPELNGRVRVVRRVQGNAFTWQHENETHDLVIDSFHDAKAHCTCKWWNYVSPTFDRDANKAIEERIRDQFAYHKTSAERESWTNYEKAGAYTFDGNRFSWVFDKAGRTTATVTLEIQ